MQVLRDRVRELPDLRDAHVVPRRLRALHLLHLQGVVLGERFVLQAHNAQPTLGCGSGDCIELDLLGFLF